MHAPHDIIMQDGILASVIHVTTTVDNVECQTVEVTRRPRKPGPHLPLVTEALASFAPGLGRGALKEFPIDFKIFQWKCPLQKESGLALSTSSEVKFQACNWVL